LGIIFAGKLKQYGRETRAGLAAANERMKFQHATIVNPRQCRSLCVKAFLAVAGMINL